jgi:hypothetical protein
MSSGRVEERTAESWRNVPGGTEPRTSEPPMRKDREHHAPKRPVVPASPDLDDDLYSDVPCTD